MVFGDVALWRGHAADYAESAPRLKRLSDAGIEVTVTTGNHDHRVPMFAAYPEQAKKTPVPGRVTSVVDLGTSDLFLLDSLNENAAGALGKVLAAVESEHGIYYVTGNSEFKPYVNGAAMLRASSAPSLSVSRRHSHSMLM